jgi:hypothetical protein
MTGQSWETKRAKELKRATRLTHTQALAIVRNEAALRINHPDSCHSLHLTRVFVSSDIRLVNNGETHPFAKEYPCMCESCLALEPE